VIIWGALFKLCAVRQQNKRLFANLDYVSVLKVNE